MSKNSTIHDILTQREEFLVIGLTGRMGSGCSKVAQVLATPFDQMNFPHPVPQRGLRSLTEEERIVRIIAEYAEAHWLKFDVIQAGAVIATFILDDDSRFLYDLNNGKKGYAERKYRRAFQKALWDTCYDHLIELGISCGILDEGTKKKEYIIVASNDEERKIQEENARQNKCFKINANTFMRKLIDDAYKERMKKELDDIAETLLQMVGEDQYLHDCFYDDKTSFCSTLFLKTGNIWNDIGDRMNYLYRVVLQRETNLHRRKYLEKVDKLLELFAFHCLVELMSEQLEYGGAYADELWKKLRAINESIQPNVQDENGILQIEKFVFVKYITTWLGKTVRRHVRKNFGEDAYARLFQRYGQMIRYKGRIWSCSESFSNHIVEEKGDTGEKKNVENDPPEGDIFAIPRRINQHIKVLRHPFASKAHRPVRIVVDSIKNVFEAVYLRYRYSAFYLWAITTDAGVREQRLRNKHLTDIQVSALEWNEYPSVGRDVIQKADKLLKELEDREDDKTITREDSYNHLMEKISKAAADFYFDSLGNNPQVKGDNEAVEASNQYHEINEAFNKKRHLFFKDNTYVFYCQDIDSCVCNADVYLFNNASGETDTDNNRKLLEAVVRNVSLVMYPCLVRPTPVERCMQIALGAKVNSGCLSRQVGAVVTDAQFNILAIGWNDVPCGEVPCAYKNLNDISASADRAAYSEYELHDTDFRDRLRQYDILPDNLRGLPFSYCFKTIHKDEKDPMRARAMHAEEKALALCGREAEGGYLFTTSSPCEMCSKNAKNHKIKRIYYLEAYPGISQAQYTNSGDVSNRAELILFSGAVGRAYMQMYTPLLPHKDVLEYLGIPQKKV